MLTKARPILTKSEDVAKSPTTHTSHQRLYDEDDELNEVETETVPQEVREWLSSTFTRSTAGGKRRDSGDKVCFKSVAHAIRAGIVVDRIYRRMSSTVGLHVPPNVVLLLKSLDDWSFDIFAVNDLGEGHTLKYIGYELMQKFDLIYKFKINTQALDNFLLRVEQGYSKHGNPYHNQLHGADVAQSALCILSQSGLQETLSELEIFAILIAALVHDFEHPGTTNNFLINTGSDMALLYNDKAVLENHHVSAAFRLMKEDDCNILANMRREDHKEFRSLVIDMVLATDMSFHFQQVKNMKSLLSLPDNIDKSKAMSLVLHCADISHVAKVWKLHSRWTMQLLEEFFRQGDKEAELGLPLSPLCDRKNTVVPESQIGFIDFIVDPTYTVLADMLDKIMVPIRERQLQQRLQRPSAVTSGTDTINNKSATPTHSRASHCKDNRSAMRKLWFECLADNKARWKDMLAKNKTTIDTIIGQSGDDLSGMLSHYSALNHQHSTPADITNHAGLVTHAKQSLTSCFTQSRVEQRDNTPDRCNGDCKHDGEQLSDSSSSTVGVATPARHLLLKTSSLPAASATNGQDDKATVAAVASDEHLLDSDRRLTVCEEHGNCDNYKCNIHNTAPTTTCSTNTSSITPAGTGVITCTNSTTTCATAGTANGATIESTTTHITSGLCAVTTMHIKTGTETSGMSNSTTTSVTSGSTIRTAAANTVISTSAKSDTCLTDESSSKIRSDAAGATTVTDRTPTACVTLAALSTSNITITEL